MFVLCTALSTCVCVCALRNNYRLNFIINSFIFVTKWEVICWNRTSVLSVDDTFSFGCCQSSWCFATLPYFLDTGYTISFLFSVMTQHVHAQTVSKIMCRLPNNAQLPSSLSLSLLLLVFSSFLTSIFGPFSFGCFHRNEDDKQHQKNHATPTELFSFRIKLLALGLTKMQYTARFILFDECNLWSTAYTLLKFYPHISILLC